MFNSLFYNERRMRAGWRLFFFMLAFTAVEFVIFNFYLRFSPLSLTTSPTTDPSARLGLQYYEPPSPSDPQFIEWNLYLHGLVLLGLLAVTFLFIKNIDRRPWVTLGFSLNRSGIKEISLGLFMGSILISVIFAVALALGALRITGVRSAEFFTSQAQSTLLFLIVGAIHEEFLLRGYLFQTLLEGVGVYPTLAATSIFFALLHIPNLIELGTPAVSTMALINLALAGVLLAIAYLRTRALWLPIGIHFAWNFLQAFVFSMPVSGLSLPPKLVQIEVTDWELMTGGTFGLEGSFITTIVLGLAVVGLWTAPWLRPAKTLDALWHEHIKPAPRGGDLP